MGTTKGSTASRPHNSLRWAQTRPPRLEAAVIPAYGTVLRLAVGALIFPAGCSQAPSQNVLGSFFPAWLLCTALGLAAAVACRVILGAVRLDKQLLAPPLGYLAVAVAVTLFTWLYRFGQ
jgi:YtcA family